MTQRLIQSTILVLLATLLALLPAAVLAGPSAPAPVAATPLDSRRPALVHLPDNSLVAVWEEDFTLVWSRQSGGSWSAPQTIVDGESARLLPTATGARLFFAAEIDAQFDIFTSGWNGNGFDPPVNISDTPTDSLAPAAARDGSTWITAWSEANTLYIGTSTDGMLWTAAPVLINTSLITGTAPSIAATGGDWQLLWQARSGPDNRYAIFYSRRTAGTWSLPTVLSTDSTIDATHPALLADSNGVVAAWQQATTGDTNEILVATGSGTPTSWDLPTPTGVGTTPALGFGDSGRRVLLWDQDKAALLATQRLPGASGWSDPQTIAANPSGLEDPTLTASAPSVAAWSQTVTAGNNDVWSTPLVFESSLTPRVYLPIILR